MYLTRDAGYIEFPLFCLVTGKCRYTVPPQATVDRQHKDKSRAAVSSTDMITKIAVL